MGSVKTGQYCMVPDILDRLVANVGLRRAGLLVLHQASLTEQLTFNNK